MTPQEFESFLKRYQYSKDRIQNMLSDTSAIQIQLRQKEKGNLVSLEEAKKVAKELRKKFAVSISLIESGLARPEDLLDDVV
jgi:translation initiation factor 1 (eIF-1/SUI1)